MAFRREDYDAVGGFDEAFYMHMEEIDFAWRLRLRGRSVRLVPKAVAFHIGSYTLPPKSLKKAYLNHRNNWVLLLKNLAPGSIAKLLPQRLALDAATLLYGLIHRDWRTPLAAMLGLVWVLLHLPQILRRRKESLATRYVHPENAKSVVVDNVTGEVIQVGGATFRHGPRSGDLP